MKKATVIGLILAMSLSLGACGGKNSSGTASASQGPETSSVSREADGSAPGTGAGAVGMNGTDTVGVNGTGIGGENMTGAAGENMTAAAGANMTAAGGNTTAGSAPSMPLILDPPSMKTAYQPETEDQKYAREITGIYLLTDLKDALSDDTGARAAQLGAEGQPMYLEFFANGTLRETVFGDPMGGLWDREYLTLGSDRIPYEFSGDHVTVTTDNMDLTFTRTTQEEIDMLLNAGRDAGSGEDVTAADGETPAGGDTDPDGQTAEEGTGKKLREERIIRVGTEDKDKADGEEESEDGTESDSTEADGIEENSTEADGSEAGGEAEDAASAGDAAGEDMGETEEADDLTEADSGTETEETNEEESAEQQMEEYIIVDDLCAMTATWYDFSDPRGFVIHVRCENYTGNNIAFNIQFAVVNNVMFEPGTPEGDEHWTLEVEPLSTRESDIIFSAEKAAEYGITSFDYVMLNLWVRNVDNWWDVPIYTGDEELYPTDNVTGKGIQNVERRSAAGEQKIAEESKFNFTILGSEVRPNGDYVLKVCIENKTWQNLTFNWDDVYVNGTLLDPFWAVETLPGTICYDDVVFTANDLAEKGVSAVSDVSFTMSVWDSKDWLSYAIYTETSTYRA